MALVGVKINGKDYQLACDDGQEQHLFELSQELDGRVQQIAAHVGQAPETMTLLLTALTLADELEEAQAEVRALEREVTKLARELRDERSHPPASEDTASLLTEVAERIEGIADKLTMQ